MDLGSPGISPHVDGIHSGGDQGRKHESVTLLTAVAKTTGGVGREIVCMHLTTVIWCM